MNGRTVRASTRSNTTAVNNRSRAPTRKTQNRPTLTKNQASHEDESPQPQQVKCDHAAYKATTTSKVVGSKLVFTSTCGRCNLFLKGHVMPFETPADQKDDGDAFEEGTDSVEADEQTAKGKTGPPRKQEEEVDVDNTPKTTPPKLAPPKRKHDIEEDSQEVPAKKVKVSDENVLLLSEQQRAQREWSSMTHPTHPYTAESVPMCSQSSKGQPGVGNFWFFRFRPDWRISLFTVSRLSSSKSLPYSRLPTRLGFRTTRFSTHQILDLPNSRHTRFSTLGIVVKPP